MFLLQCFNFNLKGEQTSSLEQMFDNYEEATSKINELKDNFKNFKIVKNNRVLFCNFK